MDGLTAVIDEMDFKPAATVRNDGRVGFAWLNVGLAATAADVVPVVTGTTESTTEMDFPSRGTSLSRLRMAALD